MRTSFYGANARTASIGRLTKNRPHDDAPRDLHPPSRSWDKDLEERSSMSMY
jgi:hypothetical protein